MDQSNTFADGINYGSVTIDADSSLGTVEFTVDAFTPAVYGSIGSNFGIQSFGFNFNTTNVTSSPGTWNPLLPSGWSQDSGGGNEDGFGLFQVTEDGTGSSRQDPLIFTLTLPTASQAVASYFAVLSTGSSGQGNVFFAAHVAGFENGGGSNFIGGSNPGDTRVPAPGAVVLGLIGLGLVGRFKRAFA